MDEAKSFLRGRGWSMRQAGPSDNARLCELLRQVHIKSDLDVTQERDPDFFGMHRMHQGHKETWVVEPDGGQVEGMWSLVTRDAAHPKTGGPPVRLVYHSDLRITEALRGGRVMADSYGPFMADFGQRQGIDLGYTVIFDSNKRARAALTVPEGKRASHPHYRPMTPFAMTSVQFTRSKTRPLRKIERGSLAIKDELGSFLKRMQDRRLFGDLDPERTLEFRLATWTGFSLEDFFVARDAKGRIVGCLAPWDTYAHKRTRVLGYHGSMAAIRFGYNAAAKLGGFASLPPPGECFRFEFLTHLEIEDDDPAVLRDLLLEVYADRRRSGLHFLSACIPLGSRLETAFKGFALNRTKMTLYAIVHPKSPWFETDLRTLHPGFEMSLS